MSMLSVSLSTASSLALNIQHYLMEQKDTNIHEEDIVIAGAGLAGLATALGLHRYGIRSVVLESSDKLRITGFALSMWANAWKALDALGVGDVLRENSPQLKGYEVGSQESCTKQSSPKEDVAFAGVEVRCVKRKNLLDTLQRELPQGTIRYSSKIVSIEKSGTFKLLHLSDGSVLKTKVLIGCDGVNSIVAKWLGLQDPVSVGRSAIRGFMAYPNDHGFTPKFHAYFGGGVRYGFIPCDTRSIYWFCTFTPSVFKYDENETDPIKMKQFVLSNISNAPKEVSDIVERTGLDSISCANLKFRLPWNVLLGNISKDNVCVVGDALHPMTPDLGQGGCSALEDSVVLARCLAEALGTNTSKTGEGYAEDKSAKMEKGLQTYAKERKWRSFSLISMAYIVGWIQERNGKIMSFLRSKFLAKFTIGATVKMATFDFGKLSCQVLD